LSLKEWWCGYRVERGIGVVAAPKARAAWKYEERYERLRNGEGRLRCCKYVGVSLYDGRCVCECAKVEEREVRLAQPWNVLNKYGHKKLKTRLRRQAVTVFMTVCNLGHISQT
jgi:hypothetical protein